MFRRYLNQLHKSALTEAVSNCYRVLVEASEGEAGKYFRKTIRNADPAIVRRLYGDTIDVMEAECPDQPKESWATWLWNWFRGDFGLRNSDAVYFAPGLARLVLCSPDSDEKFEYYPKDPLSPNADMLKKLVHYITMAHKDDYTRFLFDKETGEPATLESLTAKYGDALKKHGEEAMKELEGLDYTPNDYVIVELTDFDTASKYAEYTEPDTWCYFEDEDTFEYYKSGGAIRLYLAYKPGFERLEPGDKGYGQSMLGIDIGPNNSLVHCNNRYNHEDDPDLDNDKNPPGDNRFDAKERSLLLGGPYYKFCPYYSEEERKRLGIMTPDDIEAALERGEDITNMVKVHHKFENGDKLIMSCEMENILKPNNTLLFDTWMDDIRFIEFADKNCYTIGKHGKKTIVDADGKQMINDWYSNIWPNGGGSITVVKDGLQNLLGYDGKFKFKKWYQHTPDQLSKNVYCARFDDKIHFIDSEENLISDLAVDGIEQFTGDTTYVIVDINGKKNILRTADCKLMLSDEFENWRQFDSGDLMLIVYKHDKSGQFTGENLIDKANPSHYLLPKWAKKIHKLVNGKYKIAYYAPDENTVYQVYDPSERKMLFDFCVDDVGENKDGFVLCKDNKYMAINLDGKPLLPRWVDDYNFDETHKGYWIKNDGKKNYAKDDKSYGLEEWFDDVSHGIGDAYIVTKVDENDTIESHEVANGRNTSKDIHPTKVNIYKNGKLLLKDWADKITTDRYKDSSNNYYVVKYNNKCTVCDENGRLLLDDLYDGINNVYENGTVIPLTKSSSLDSPHANVCINGKPVLDGEYYIGRNKAYCEYRAQNHGNFIEAYDDFIMVRKDGKMNVLLLSGKWLMDRWYDNIDTNSQYQFVFIVKLNDKYNMWNKDHIEFDHWYNYGRCDHLPYGGNYYYLSDTGDPESGVPNSTKNKEGWLVIQCGDNIGSPLVTEQVIPGKTVA